jgi:hypothetical protein
MTRIVRLVSHLALTTAIGCAAEQPTRRSAPAQSPSVAVVFALQGPREHHVPWRTDLTLHRAIDEAQQKSPARWKEAWRYRASFWTRHFRNPHSIWARLLAGEKATGYTYVANSPSDARSAPLRPGDRIYVDLAPVY